MVLPAISIVTPTFNQAGFLPDTLESVVSQKYPDLEHIVVDAMSTDATPEILETYSKRPRVKVLREKDNGQSDGINKGVALATGEIVSWLNSDDVLEPGALEAVARAFEDHPRAVAVCGIGSKMDRKGELIRTVPFRRFDPVRLRTALEFIQPATFYRRSAWEAVGGLQEDLHYAMDWDLLIRLAKVGEIISFPARVARIRYYEDTKTSTGGWKRAAEIARIGRKHNGVLDLNAVSFLVRDNCPKVRLLRRAVDTVFWRISKKFPVMVLGWPD